MNIESIRDNFFGTTIDDKMDMAKYKCISISMYSVIDNQFPKLEEKWAKSWAKGKEHEVVFSLMRDDCVKTTVHIFESQEGKSKFSTDLNLISTSNEKLFSGSKKSSS